MARRLNKNYALQIIIKIHDKINNLTKKRERKKLKMCSTGFEMNWVICLILFIFFPLPSHLMCSLAVNQFRPQHSQTMRHVNSFIFIIYFDWLLPIKMKHVNYKIRKQKIQLWLSGLDRSSWAYGEFLCGLHTLNISCQQTFLKPWQR